MNISTLSILGLSVAVFFSGASFADAGPVPHTDKHATAAHAPKGFTRITMKKSGASVELAYQLVGTPEVGKPMVIKIQMLSPAPAQLSVRADEGLQLQASPVVLQSAAGVTANHQFSVTPLAQGRFYLNLLSTSNGRSSANAIAVQVGKQVQLAKPTGNIKTMPDGERVKSLPAQ